MKKRMMTVFLVLYTFMVYPADWPMYMGNFYLTGNNDEIPPRTNRLNWSFKAPKYVTNAVSANFVVYVTSIDGYLYAVSEETGRIKWEFNTEKPILAMPVIGNGYVVTSSGRKLFCLNERTGQIIWARFDPNNFSMFSTPVIYKDRVIYASRKTVYARQLRNGHDIWTNDSFESYGASPVIYEDIVVFSGKSYRNANSTFLTGINANTGQIVWKTPVEHDPNSFTPLIKDGKIFYASANRFYRINVKTGEIELNKQFASHFGSEAKYSNGNIYISGTDGNIYVINPEDGSEVKKFSHHSRQGTKFILVGHYIYTTTDEGYLYCIESETGEVKWKFKALHPRRGKILCASNGRAYYTVWDRVYSLSDGALPVQEQPRETEPIHRIAQNTGTPYNRYGNTPSSRYTPNRYSSAYSNRYGTPYSRYNRNNRVPDRTALRTNTPYSRINPSEGRPGETPSGNTPPDTQAGLNPNRIPQQPDNSDRSQNRNPITPGTPESPSVSRQDNDIVPPAEPVTAPRNREIRGTIVDQGTNHSIPGEVIAIPRHDRQGRQRLVVPVGPDGRFQFNIPDDDYDITFRSPGFSFNTVPLDRGRPWKEETVGLVRLKTGNKFILHNLFFEVHKATLLENSLTELRRAVKLLRDNPNVRIEIRGHTDSTGNREYNFTFSHKRAEVVRNFLLKHGISPQRLVVRGVGPSEPIATNDTSEGRAKNRRVEFHVIGN